MTGVLKKTKRVTAPEPYLPLWQDDTRRIAVRLGNAQDIGRRREQQDAFGWSDVPYGEGRLAAVLADGMGGLADGAGTSRLAVSHVLAHLDPDGAVPPFLEQTADALNEQVLREAARGAPRGTTLCVAVVVRDALYWLCVGDSRLYLLRGGRLCPVNQDHNQYHLLLTAFLRGDPVAPASLDAESEGALTSYIGCPDFSDMDINRRPFALQDGDTLLLCTDGVYRALSEPEMTAVLRQAPPQAAADELVRRAVAKRLKGQDNLTVMTIEYVQIMERVDET